MEMEYYSLFQTINNELVEFTEKTRLEEFIEYLIAPEDNQDETEIEIEELTEIEIEELTEKEIELTKQEIEIAEEEDDKSGDDEEETQSKCSQLSNTDNEFCNFAKTSIDRSVKLNSTYKFLSIDLIENNTEIVDIVSNLLENINSKQLYRLNVKKLNMLRKTEIKTREKLWDVIEDILTLTSYDFKD